MTAFTSHDIVTTMLQTRGSKDVPTFKIWPTVNAFKRQCNYKKTQKITFIS